MSGKRKILSPFAEGTFEVEPDHFGVELAEKRLGGWRFAAGDPGYAAQQEAIAAERDQRQAPAPTEPQPKRRAPRKARNA